MTAPRDLAWLAYSTRMNFAGRDHVRLGHSPCVLGRAAQYRAVVLQVQPTALYAYESFVHYQVGRFLALWE